MEDCIHQPLEGTGGVAQPKREDCELKQPESGDKRCLVLIPRLDGDLMVPLLQVYAGDHTCTRQPIKEVINSRQWILV